MTLAPGFAEQARRIKDPVFSWDRPPARRAHLTAVWEVPGTGRGSGATKRRIDEASPAEGKPFRSGKTAYCASSCGWGALIYAFTAFLRSVWSASSRRISDILACIWRIIW